MPTAVRWTPLSRFLQGIQQSIHAPGGLSAAVRYQRRAHSVQMLPPESCPDASAPPLWFPLAVRGISHMHFGCFAAAA
jgi:hypothetical protein